MERTTGPHEAGVAGADAQTTGTPGTNPRGTGTPGADAQGAGAERDGAVGPDGQLADEVDELVAQWRTQRPDLDVEPLHVLSRVSRLAKHLDIARRGAFAGHGLEYWEFDVLSALRRSGPPFQLTPGELLRATLVTSGTMTNRIDRLAASGLVRREPDPRDRRGVLVTLTERGRARVDAAFTDLLDREQALLADLADEDRKALAAMLRTLLAPFDAVLLAGGRPPAPPENGGLRAPHAPCGGNGAENAPFPHGG